MMHQKGLTKLKEECGELITIAAKKSSYINHSVHPDGQILDVRMEEEIADVLAAVEFVIGKFSLSTERIEARRKMKVETYLLWDKEAE